MNSSSSLLHPGFIGPCISEGHFFIGVTVRLVLLTVLLTGALVGCSSDGPSTPPGPDTVFISPRFVEPMSAELIPQLYDYDWTLEGTTTDPHGQGPWALTMGPE